MVDHARPKFIGRTRHLTETYGTVRLDAVVLTYGMTMRKQRSREQTPIARLCHDSFRRLQSAHILCLRLLPIIFTLFITLSVSYGVFSPSYATPPKHYRDLENRVRSSLEPGRGNLNNEKVFIAANIVDESLIRGSWGNNLLSLVDLLGEENVFVSIYENDSGSDTAAALRELQERLPCKHLAFGFLLSGS